MHQSRLQSRRGVGSMLEQLRPTGLRIPTEPLPALSTYSTTTRARLTTEMAPYSSAMRLDFILAVSSDRGCAQARDLSVASAGVWLRARPPREDEDRGRFAHFVPGGVRIEHRAALLLRPPASSHVCHGCGQEHAWSTYAHFGACACGVRSTPVLHHPVKQVILSMLRSVLPAHQVLDGDVVQPRGQRAGRDGEEWWRIYSAFKRPDIIVINFPRTGCHTIIDVKTFDAASASHVRQDHTDLYTLGAHRELEQSLIREYIQERRGGRVVETHERQRALFGNELICAAISRQGAIGPQLLTLIRRLVGMHSQRTRDVLTSSFSFEEVWRHRLSVCVHTQAASRMLSLVSAVAEEVGAEADGGRLDMEAGMTAAWMRRWFTSAEFLLPEEARRHADGYVREMVLEATGVALEPAEPMADAAPADAATADGADGEAMADAEEEAEGEDEAAAAAAEAQEREGEAEAAEAAASEDEQCQECGYYHCLCDEASDGAALADEAPAAMEADDAVADAEVEQALSSVVTGPHRPPHPEYMSSGPVAPLGAPSFTGADGSGVGDDGGDGSGGGGGLGDVGVLGGGDVSGVRGEEVVRDVLGALGAEALGVGGVGVGASVGCALLDPPSVPCPECEHVECRCVVPRVWSRGGWRERDEFDDLD